MGAVSLDAAAHEEFDDGAIRYNLSYKYILAQEPPPDLTSEESQELISADNDARTLVLDPQWSSDEAATLDSEYTAGLLGHPFIALNPGVPPISDDPRCALQGPALVAAANAYEAIRLKDIDANLDWKARVSNLKATVASLENQQTLGDIYNTSQSLKLSLNLISDTLSHLLPGPEQEGYEKFSFMRDWTDVFVSANGSAVSKDVDAQVDTLQIVTSLSRDNIFLSIANLLTDAVQANNQIHTTIDQHADLSSKIQKAQSQIDRLEQTTDHAGISQMLANSYAKVNDLFKRFANECISQATFDNGELVTPSQPGTPPAGQSAPANPAATVPSMGVLEFDDTDIQTHVVLGTREADTISERAGNNVVVAGDGDDAITVAGDGNVVFGGSGNDSIDFGTGSLFNTAAFSGNFQDYSVSRVGDVVTVVDKVANRDGTDVIKGTDQLKFLDGLRTIADPNPPQPKFNVTDTSANINGSDLGGGYTGPVSGLTSEYVNLTSDSLSITTSGPNVFVHTGSGNDAINVGPGGGANVLDGGTGSNFLTGATGNDTFFVDDRGPMSDIWSTVNNFHSGDAATIWGVAPNDFDLSWVDGEGATGYTGLTLHATSAGLPTASLTLAGFTSADMTDGKLTVSFGTTAASGSVAGSPYMYVHAN